MALIRPSLLGAKTLGRALSVWPFLLLFAWAMLIRFQEPAFFAHQKIPFFWPSLQGMLLLVLGLLPLAWRLSQGIDAGAWTLQTSRSPATLVVTTWLSLVAYGLLVIAATVAAAAIASLLAPIFTLYRISPGSWQGLVPLLQTSLEFLIIVSAFAPVLALLPWRTSTVVFAWLTVLAAALRLLGPPEFSEVPGASAVSSGILSAFLATLGGLAVSLAHTHHRLRH